MFYSQSNISLSVLLTTWLIWCPWFSPVLSTAADGGDPPASPECRCNATADVRDSVTAAAAPIDTCSGPNDGDSLLTTCTRNVNKVELSQSDPWYLTEQANSLTGNADDYWEEFDCEDLFSSGVPRPIHDAQTWLFLRGVYLGVVGPHLSTIDAEDLFRNDGFEVPIQVVHIPNKGRGVIAVQDIPEGTLVWDSVHTARFSSPTMYRRFLASLPDDLACDVMIWAYVEDHPPITQGDSATGSTALVPTISVDLDAGSFMNTVSAKDVTNLDPETYKTNRLIRAGEELIVDYRDFEKEGSWNAAGFGTKYKNDEWL